MSQGGQATRGTRVAMIDGRLASSEDAKVSVYDRGFLYGDSVFEVLRTYAGVPFALREHVARLRRSAERVLIALPLDDDAFAAEIERAVAAAAHVESYVRVVVTRGSGPLSLDPDSARAPLRVILVEPVSPPPRAAYADGIAAAIVRSLRATDDTTAAGAKVGNYLANLLAMRQAKQIGAQEAIVVDAQGRVLEGASSNVFVVKDGRVATPPASAGILVGITRAHVIGAAARLGVPVDERDVSASELTAADEVFVTSSIRELLSVVRIDGHPVGAGAPGPTARALHRSFRGEVGLGDRAMPWE